MSDLIDRQAAIDYVDDVPYIKMHPNIGLLWKAWIEQLPSAQPTIDAIPVDQIRQEIQQRRSKGQHLVAEAMEAILEIWTENR